MGKQLGPYTEVKKVVDLDVLNGEPFAGRFSYWDDAIPFPAGIPRQTAAPGD